MKKVIICSKNQNIKELVKMNKAKDVCFFSKDSEVVEAIRKMDYEADYLIAHMKITDAMRRMYEVLDSLSNGITDYIEKENVSHSYFYEASYKMEGTSLGRRLLDAYYTNYVMTEYEKQNCISEIVFYYDDLYCDECEFLFFWAKEHKVSFKCIFPKKTKWTSKMKLLYHGGPGINRILSLANSLRIGKLTDRILESIGIEYYDKYDIGIVKQSAKEKDFNWTKEGYDSLVESGFSVCIVATTNEVAQKWSQRGYSVVSYENFVNREELFHNRINYLRNFCKLYTSLKKRDYTLDNTGISKELLLQLLFSQYCEQIVNDIRIDNGARHFFQNIKFKIISYHGDTNYMSSKISYFNCREAGQRNTRFQNCWGSLQTFYLPFYEPHVNRAQFSFVISSRFIKSKMNGITCYKNKSLYYSALAAKEVVMPQNDIITLLWAPSYPTRGMLSHSFFQHCNDFMIESVENKNVKLMIKYHPNISQIEVERTVEKAKGKENILFRNKEENILDIIKSVDVIVSVTSLTILEAVYLQKPVICLVDEYSKEMLEIHKDGLLIYDNFNEVFKLVNNIFQERNNYEIWKQNTLQRQNSYFGQFIYNKCDDKNFYRLKALKREIEIYDKTEGCG